MAGPPFGQIHITKSTECGFHWRSTPALESLKKWKATEIRMEREAIAISKLNKYGTPFMAFFTVVVAVQGPRYQAHYPADPGDVAGCAGR